MTRYRVDLSARAVADLHAAYDYIRQHGPANPDRWKSGFERKIATLESFPERCGLAAESQHSRVEIRQVLYGSFRALFTIRADRVFVLTIRHGARKDLPPEEIERIT